MSTRRSSVWVLSTACVLGLLFQAWIVSQQGPALIEGTLEGHNDFLQLYVGASLCGTGQLYSLEANQRLQSEFIGRVSPSVRYSRLPFYSLLLRPLTWMPYRTAYWTFQALSLGSLLAFACLAVPRTPLIAPLLCFSIPALMTLKLGQDVFLVLLAFAVYQALSERGKALAAGLVLSLCLVKFHLFVLVGAGLVLTKQRQQLMGAAAGAALWLSLSFLAGGSAWIGDYVALLRDPALHPSPSIMPNLHGMSLGHAGWEWTLVGFVVLLFVTTVWRVRDEHVRQALALTGGLLISRHAYIQDSVLILAAVPLVLRAAAGAPTTFLLLLFCSPIAAILQLLNPPVSAIPAAVLLTSFTWICVSSLRRSANARSQLNAQALHPTVA